MHLYASRTTVISSVVAASSEGASIINSLHANVRARAARAPRADACCNLDRVILIKYVFFKLRTMIKLYPDLCYKYEYDSICCLFTLKSW